jgi:hypothetical protein
MTATNYSPKLREAMARIIAILNEQDIAGYVVLHEPGFAEYLLAVEPSWSCLRMIGEVGIRLRSKLEDYGGDKERQHLEIEATTNLLRHLADLLPRHAAVFEELHSKVCELMEVEHTEGVHTPYRPH